jgi:predicted MFS family arabinose efflux permease
MHPTLPPRRELSLLLTLSSIQFTNIVDFMMMMPLGPQFTELFGISDAQFGFLVSVYMLAGGVSGLAATTYVDRFGRKRLLLLCYAMFCLASVGCALAPTYGVLLAARLLAGVFGGVIAALCHTIVGEIIPFERRGRAMAIVMTAFSLATVAGVPAGLLLAELWGWHAPFFAVASLGAMLWVRAALSMPALDAHLSWKERPALWRGIAQVLADRNHLKALAFTALLMSSGFLVIPYIALYVRSNTQIRSDELPYMYLFGGLLSIATARLIGRVTDRRGKVWTFRLLSSLALAPMAAITLLRDVPAWTVVLVSGVTFMFVSGRSIPGTSILTAAAHPRWRGTFMTLNSAVQSAAMGLAALITGQLISRDAQGYIQGFWMAALAGGAASLAAMALAGRLLLHGAGDPGQEPAAAP